MTIQYHAMETTVPKQLKVMRVVSPGGLDARVAWETACGHCKTAFVAFVASQAGEHLYVLAAPADEVTPGTWCPFASVLPVQPILKTVAYSFTTSAHQTVLVLQPDEAPLLYSGSAGNVARAVEKFGVEIEVLDAERLEQVTPWTIQNLAEEKFVLDAGGQVTRRSLQLAVASFTVTMVSALVCLVMAALSSAATEAASRRAEGLVQEARNLASNDVALQLARLDGLDRALLQSGGLLMSYKAARNSPVVWQARLPRTVTGDVIEELGGRSESALADGGVYVVSK